MTRLKNISHKASTVLRIPLFADQPCSLHQSGAWQLGHKTAPLWMIRKLPEEHHGQTDPARNAILGSTPARSALCCHKLNSLYVILYQTQPTTFSDVGCVHNWKGTLQLHSTSDPKPEAGRAISCHRTKGCLSCPVQALASQQPWQICHVCMVLFPKRHRMQIWTHGKGLHPKTKVWYWCPWFHSKSPQIHLHVHTTIYLSQ